MIVPNYYHKFKCIASACKHSCCIGWEINVDEDKALEYRAVTGEMGERLEKNIAWEETPHFILGEGERCPFLNEHNLCDLILNLGEECLCEICREHPRFYNYTDVAEVGLGMSCREAARLILSSPNYYVTEEIGQTDAEELCLTFNGRLERERVFDILQAKELDYQARIKRIRSDYGIDSVDDSVWLEMIDSLEYLDESHRELFMNYSDKKRAVGWDECLERALAYFVYRHCTEAFDEEDFRARLAFCLFCERLLSSLIVSQGAETVNGIAALASIISEEIEYSENNTEMLTY